MRHNSESIRAAIAAVAAATASSTELDSVPDMLQELAHLAEQAERDRERTEPARASCHATAEGIVEMVAALEFWQDSERTERYEELTAELSEAHFDAEDGQDHSFKEWLQNMADDPQGTLQEAAAELAELEAAAGDCTDADEARERIQEDPLELTLSGTWSPGETPEADGFIILLSTGGPAVRIRGRLGMHGEPDAAWLEYQDWGTPWMEYHGDGCEHDTLLTYCGCFYFGEG